MRCNIHEGKKHNVEYMFLVPCLLQLPSITLCVERRAHFPDDIQAVEVAGGRNEADADDLEAATVFKAMLTGIKEAGQQGSVQLAPCPALRRRS